MKKITVSLLVLLFLLQCFVSFANAETVFTAESKLSVLNLDGKTSLNLRIWGTSEAGGRVSLKIIRPDIDESSTDLSLFDKYAYIGQTKADSSNKYVFDILFNEDCGDYKLVITEALTGASLEKNIFMPSADSINDITGKVNSDYFTGETFNSYIEENSREIGFDISLYEQLENTIKMKICEKVISTHYSGFPELYEELNKSVLLYGVSQTKKYELLGKLISYYESDYLNISDEEIYSLFEEYSENKKTAVYEIMTDSEIYAIEDIKTEFYKALFTSEVKNVINYKEINSVFEKFPSWVLPDLTDYNNLTAAKQDKVLYYVSKELTKIKSYNDFVELLNKIVSNINSLIAAENTSNNSGSFGGGGGGGGTSVKIDRSAIPKLPEMTDNGNQFEEKPIDVNLPDYEGSDIFSDLAGVEWAHEAIFKLNKSGILNGKEKNRFFPNDNTKRSEFVKMLVSTMGLKDDGEEINFSDVNASDWFYPYVKIAYANGVVSGIGNNKFNPEANITRQDAATAIYKAMTLKNYIYLTQVDSDAVTDFQKISDYAKNAVLMLKSYGVINGYADGSFKPDQKITRAECAVMLNNIIDLEYVINASRTIVSETEGLLDIGSMQTINQSTKPASRSLNEATVISLDSETDYTASIRNQKLSSPGSEFNTNVLYFDYDLRDIRDEYSSVTKGFITVLVKIIDDEDYYPGDLRLCAYDFDIENKSKRYPTDQAYLGKMLDSKAILKDYTEIKAKGYYQLTFDVTEGVNNALKAEKDIFKVAFTMNSEDLKEYTKEIIDGINSYSATDFSMGIVLNTKATRQYNGTEIIYGDSQPVLNLYK